MRTNPLYRALRVDKMTIVALDGVLREHQEGRGAGLPALRMLSASADAVRARTEAFRERLPGSASGLTGEIAAGSSAVGGGAAPAVELPTAVLRLRHATRGPDALARALRLGDPAVLARVAEDALVLDLRTVAPEEEAALLSAIAAAVRA
jgi:L-seryl-tRNA(Ser) seleniumtransferase